MGQEQESKKINESNKVNFADEIARLEEIQEKLLAKQQLDNNLKDFINERLTSNLACFKENFPQVYKRFENFKPEGKYRLFCTDNGEVNVFVEKEQKPLYQESPFAQCKEQVDIFLNGTTTTGAVNSVIEYDPFGQIHFQYKNALIKKIKEELQNPNSLKLSNFESIPAVFMFGIGLGYQIGYLYERIEPVNIYIIEPDLEMFYLSLCVFDYGPWIEYVKAERLGVKFFLSDDKDLLVNDMGEYFTKFPATFANKLLFEHYTTQKLSEFLSTIKMMASSFNLGKGFFDDFLFGFANGCKNIVSGHRVWVYDKKLPNYAKKIPLIMVGNGPSLDKDLPLLKKYQNKAIILACGTAYSVLCRYGIKPDIYVALERISNVYNALISTKEQGEYFDETLCIAPDIVHPKTLSLFKHVVLGLKINEILPIWLTAIKVIPFFKKYTLLNRINPLVSNMGLRVASLLGFSNIYFLGVDNGTAEENNAHSRFSMYYDEKGNLKKGYEKMALNINPESYPGNFRETISTNSLFKSSIRIMNECISEYPNLHYFNCSDGAKIEGAQAIHFSELDWESKSDVNKKAVCDYIEYEMSEPLKVTEDYLKSNLFVDKFNEILDEIIKRLRRKETTRVGFILMEDEIFAYINSYSNHGFALAGCILGSLNQMLASINTVLYSYEDESLALTKGYAFIDDVIEFLEQVRKIYPHCMDYVQGEHKQYQEV